MEGFFTKKETDSASRPDGKKHSCISCGLYKNVKSPRMKPYGNFRKGIMNIGEAPGEIEDRTGRPFQGKTGKLLQQAYKSLGIDLFEDCININACHCRPLDSKGNNRPPTRNEVDNCRRITLAYIKQYQPKVIVLLGNSALISVLGHRWKKDLGTITKWRGHAIPDLDLEAWICPTFHPSYVERSFFASASNQRQNSVEEAIWMQDLKQIASLVKKRTYQGKTYLERPFPKYVEPKIEVIEDLSVLNSIQSGIIAFDYETTGKKPHAQGHKIVSCAIADNANHCYVFLLPASRRARQPLVDLLARPSVRKVAQNMKFEETWSVVRLRQSVVNWYRDTMLMTHVQDNRQGITGLKFQAYLQFGVIDYSSELDPWLKPTKEKSANAFNRILELLEKPGGKEKLLKYNALDAIYEYRLMEKQEINMLPF